MCPGDEMIERPDEQITEERLFEAVEVCSMAIRELAPEGLTRPLEIHGSPMQPDYLADFTRFEIEQAEAFMRRMDMLPDPTSN